MFTITIILLLVSGLIYNHLVRLNNVCNEAWSSIDVQLKRRYDLVTSLVEVVKGYTKHESSLLEEVTKLRSECTRPHTIEEQDSFEGKLSTSLTNLIILVEDYPELSASEHYLNLQRNLSQLEDYIQKARRYYNGTVRELNTFIESFPSNLFALVFNYKKKPFFLLQRIEERAVPKVRFSENENT